ncbi:MAG: acyl-CoA thioesterase [Thermoleophilia bacterium]|nr:acyl-CoA thioesterase [Thermoleophilia bacterium]
MTGLELEGARLRDPDAGVDAMAIRWRDLDPLGHVNHEVFLTYLEHMRDRWLSRMSEGSLGPRDYVVGRVEVDFRAELTQETGWINGICELKSLGRSSVTTAESLTTPDGTLAATATAVLVMWDPMTRASRPLTQVERTLLSGTDASSDPNFPDETPTDEQRGEPDGHAA